MNKQKLELTWIGKDKRPRLEPRIFLEDMSLSYQAPSISTNSDSDVNRAFNDNLLIHGDNLLALKALEQQYAGKVKCIFIDPPYNTGSAFTHYDDGVEHSMWLTMMRDRLELLRTLMSEDGSIWITIDDNEAHYLKIICDDIFGRVNFVSNAIWHKKYTVANDAKWLSENHDHVLIYAKNKETWRPNRLPRSEDMDKRYSNPDNHAKGPWKATPLYAKRKGSEKEQAFTYTFKNGFVWTPPKGTSPRFPEYKMREMDLNDEIWFGVNGDANPSRKTFLSELKIQGTPAPTIWSHTEVGHNHQATEEVKALTPDDAFSTPKPEKLLERIIFLATNEGDLVLDSFAGSGTTGAVAHKMGRRWIMVELGEHCHTHIVPRLKKVIDGEDQGGISKSVNWQGGGGFRYLRLAPSLLKKDDWGNWVINKEYNAEMLAEAVCKHMSFTYAPSQTQFWNHGYSTETDHIYVTTGSLAYDQLKRISEEVGNERTLLICCKAFMMDGADFPNLTLKKIPKVILNKCEWDHDDYSFTLNVLPEEQDEEWAEDDSEE
ncbi:site-specific DNA-methyltransferase [Aeromonas caviae]|uniref:site-specific DNA-methyltransferase n=1 Tax=Aeromonas caviae TaxID=648 RepID=UPI001D0A23BC|nr:site-specific DNA-methyltransferase [Aeromonas caviae]UDN27741.1 site-specific DNA-methyltransferase [Aeromonas caviae]